MKINKKNVVDYVKKLKFKKKIESKIEKKFSETDLSIEDRTLGQKVADTVAATVGSWKFIITQSILLAIWVILNVLSFAYHWDPYPFILLNLMLSFQAAYTGPIVMMSQNRQTERDRAIINRDFELDKQTKEEVFQLLKDVKTNHDLLHELAEQMNMELKTKRINTLKKN